MNTNLFFNFSETVNVYFLFSMAFFWSGWMSTYFFRKQILSSLLSLEFMVLATFVSLMGMMSMLEMPVYFTLYLLVMGVTEASLGLSLLVSIVRMLGNDMLSKTKMIKC